MTAYFRFVEQPLNEEDYYRNLEAAERLAIDELGAFPLFRPTLFMTVHKHIGGLEFGIDGRLESTDMIRIDLPGTESERAVTE